MAHGLGVDLSTLDVERFEVVPAPGTSLEALATGTAGMTEVAASCCSCTCACSCCIVCCCCCCK